MDQCIDTRGCEYLESIFHDIAASMDCSTPAQAIKRFRQMMDAMDMNSPVSDQTDLDLPVLISSVNPVRLKNNPIQLDSETIRSLYRKIVK